MTFEDIKAKRKEIETQIADLQSKLAAINAVIEMFSGQPLPSDIVAQQEGEPPLAPSLRSTKMLAGPSLLEAIRNALKEMPAQFNVRYVRLALYKAKPEYTFLTSSLSNALKKLADGGEIKLIMLGSGRRPSRYAKLRANETIQTKQ